MDEAATTKMDLDARLLAGNYADEEGEADIENQQLDNNNNNNNNNNNTEHQRRRQQEQEPEEERASEHEGSVANPREQNDASRASSGAVSSPIIEEGRRTSTSPLLPSSTEKENALLWGEIAFYQKAFGQHPPGGSSCFTLAGAWYVIVRLAMAAALFSAPYVIAQSASGALGSRRDGPYGYFFSFGCILPVILTILIAAVGSWNFLPAKFNDIRGPSTVEQQEELQRIPVTLSDVKKAGQVSAFFTVTWLLVGLIASVVHGLGPGLSTSDAIYKENRNIYGIICVNLLITCSCTPTLGGYIFILAIDVSRSLTLVQGLAGSAIDKSLTASQYKTTAERIHSISESWRTSLSMLSFVGLLNAAGMLVYTVFLGRKLHMLGLSAWAIFYEEIYIICVNGKEACLMLVFLHLIMSVNDAADGVATDVYQWPIVVGASEDELDQRLQRSEVLLQSMTFPAPRDPSERRSIVRRIIAAKAGGISFMALGVRWTSGYVTALGVSLGSSLFGSFSYMYLHYQG